jgi:hypothetical protein
MACNFGTKESALTVILSGQFVKDRISSVYGVLAKFWVEEI